MKLIIFAFVLSISLHLLIFNEYTISKTQINKQKINKDITKKANITFVKLKKVTKKAVKKPLKKLKEKKSVKKIIEKKKIKKPIRKTIPKKFYKAKKKIQFQKKRVKNIKKVEKKSLQDILLNEQIVDKTNSIQNKTLEDFLAQEEKFDKKTLSMIDRLYGREFENYTKLQKAFIKNKLKSFYEVTQETLNQMGYPRLAAKLEISGENIVEFILYPDGSIKNLKILNSSSYSVLDDYTLELIEVAYKDYPRPKTATKIRFNVTYRLF